MNGSEIEQLVKQYTDLSKGVVNYDKLAHYVATFHSTSIEGSTLTENEVINLLDQNKTAKSKPFEHHLMVRDYYEALNFVIAYTKEKKPISVRCVQEIAALTMKNTGVIVKTILGDYDVSKGEYRLSGVFAGKRQFPDSKKVPLLMNTLIDSINSEMTIAQSMEQKMKIAFRIHFEFLSIHPFGDGNGRTSRLLMNYIQSYFEIPLTIVFKQDRIKYIEAIEKSRKEENLEPFYTFMFHQLGKYLKQEIKLLSE